MQMPYYSNQKVSDILIYKQDNVNLALTYLHNLFLLLVFCRTNQTGFVEQLLYAYF